jgi:tight adherence protein B
VGALLGLVLGLGLLLVWSSLGPPRAPRPRGQGRPGRQRVGELLAQAGIEGVTPARLGVACLGVGAAAGLAMTLLSRSATIGLVFGLLAVYGPMALVRYRRRRRRVELRELWPEVVDNLASAVRAGLSLPEALTQLGVRGPDQLRGPFTRFGEDYRATGRFADSLDRLKEALADPVADRIVEALRMAREVGGSDLGRLLRTLSAFLREDARTRAELESRQSWTVNGARLAVAAPWVVLAMLSLNPEAVAAYDSVTGAAVLGVGALACLVAYRLMLRIGRLPDEERVLR